MKRARRSINVLFLFMIMVFGATLWQFPQIVSAAGLGNVTAVSQSGDMLTISVGSDKVIVQACEQGLLRVDYQPGGVSDADTMVIGNTSWAAVGATINTSTNPMTITTNKMIVKINKTPCRISVYNSSNQLLIKEQDTEGVFSRGVKFAHYTGQRMYGLHGYNCFEDVGRTLDITGWSGNISAGFEGDCAGPFVWSTSGYGVLVDTTDGQATVNSSEINFSNITKRDTEYYIMVGEPKDIMQMFARVSGKPPMFPKASLGFTYSKWGLNETDFRNNISTFRSKGIPLDSIGLDFDHLNWGGTNYGEWNWNTTKFPNGANGSFGSWCASQGVKIIGIRKPRIRMDSQQGNYATANNYWHPLTPLGGDVDYFGGYSVGNLDFAKSAVRSWFWNYNKHFFLNDGIWCWWMDESDFDGTPYDNLLSINIAKGFWENQRAESTKRLWTLFRNYYPGAQRYGYCSWTADVPAGFYNMQQDPYAIFAALNLGLTRMTQDSAGWQGQPSETEYARGLQFGTFLPIMRVHSDVAVNRLPWLYGSKAEAAASNAIRLRYQLIPYLYCYEKIAADTGLGMMRPLYWEYPGDANCSLNAQGWMLGDSLLVYPVMADEGRKSIYLPAGTWIDYFRGTVYNGGQTITYTLSQDSLMDIPVFIKKGAIIPKMDVMNYVGEKPLTTVYLDIYPSTAQSTFKYYDDDGTTYNYGSGSYFAQTITAQDNTSNISVNLNAKDNAGSFIPTLQNYICQIHGRAGTSVSSNGAMLTQYADLSDLKAAGGEGWAIGSDVSGEITYVKVASGIQKNIVVSGTATTSGIVKYEAENGMLQNGVSIASSQANYSGSGFAKGYTAVGANTAFDVSVKNYGTYDVALRYANATGSPKTVSIYVNGTKVKQTSLSNLANWDTWADKVESFKLTSGNNVISFKYDSGDSGNIYIDYIKVPVNAAIVDPDPTPIPPSPPPTFNGDYKIINRATGKAMEVADSLTVDGANIQQWSYTGANCQKWQIVNVGGYDFKIVNKNSGKTAEVADSGVGLGDNIQQWTYGGADCQKWIITSLGNGYYKIINKNSMKGMEVADEQTSDGANIAQWSYVGSNFQQWQIVSLGGTPPPTTVTIDNGAAGYSTTGTWSTTATGGYNNTSYQYATAGTAKTATWAPNLQAGTWRVSIMYKAGTNRATSAKFNVATASGTQTVYVNQMQNNLTWVTLGTWSMSAGGGNVTLDAAGSSGGTSPQVIADVVRYEYVSP